MQMDIPVSDALKEPTNPVSLGFQILLGLANAGATITLIPVLTVLIPAQVTRIDPLRPASSLAVVLASGAVAALVGNPLAGALSDRTTSHLGRRRPWLLVGALGAALGLLMLAYSRTIPVLAAAWFTVQFFGNILLSSYNAILPDRVPVRQRGTTQAIIGLSSPVAIILSDLLFARAHNMTAVYLPIIAVQVVLAALFVLLYRETVLPKGNLPPFRLGPFLASFWVSPRKYPRFNRIWWMWFMLWLGYTVGAGGFFFLYVQNITGYERLFPGHLAQEAIALIQMLQIGIGVPVMMASGVLSDRSGRRAGFVFAGAFLMFAGLVSLVAFSTWVSVLIAGIAIGAGFWLFYSLGQAMITQMLPSAAERGKHLGVINIASTLPQVFMPWVGAAVINAFGSANAPGYQILFGIAAFAVILGMVILRFIPSTHK